MDTLQLFKEKIMVKNRKYSFDIDSYIRNTPPLTDEEFNDMMTHDNDEIPIDDLYFDDDEDD